MKQFFTPNLVRQLPVAVISGGLIAMIGFKSQTVHIPFLINVVLSLGLGWLQPRKGWLLALLQTLTILVTYSLFSNSSLLVPAQPEVARFAALLAVFPTLTGAFMGALLGRTIKDKQ
ncbi:hypothetical protein [Telluribacter sp.]|jgi:hypothetical protein|uniref:hypothetical protein n=1 Tax=Telluribacter sp. TaxID=1978767 RepID=UPI002E0F9A46|nr:hypothetical protein [Telluribacter sp.]